MSSQQSPIALLESLKERAVGFFFKRPVPSSVPQQIVSVDLGHSHLLVLAVEKKVQKVEVTQFFLEPRAASPEGVSDQLKRIFDEAKLSPEGVRTAVKTEGMVIRILSFPQMKKSELSSMLHYESEKYIPFKSSEAVLDFQILTENITRGEMKTMEVVLVAVRQSEILSFVELFQKAGIELSLIDVGAFAISNLVEFTESEVHKKPVAFLDMGMDSSTFGILYLGRPLFIRDISFGGGDILKMLKRKLGMEASVAMGLSMEQMAKSEDYSAMAAQALAGLVNELKLSLGYYQDHVHGFPVLESLFVFGGGFRFLPELGHLQREIQLAVRRSNILSNVEIHPRVDRASLQANEDLLSIALGLCVR